jgi:hypothetical protein
MKFFKEQANNKHFDIRYGNGSVYNKDIIKEELRYLLKEFVRIATPIHVRPVLMHGGLIGWMFNKDMLPWDDDIDMVIIGHEDIDALLILDGMQTDEWLFEINPNYSNNLSHNVIDARMISKQLGVFIDITFFRKQGERYVAKDGHSYETPSLLPLHEDYFMSTLIYIPNDVHKVLKQEYGQKVFKCTFKDWVFKENTWSIKPLAKYVNHINFMFMIIIVIIIIVTKFNVCKCTIPAHPKTSL